MRQILTLGAFVIIFLEGLILCGSRSRKGAKRSQIAQHSKRENFDPLSEKQERDVINSFVNAWQNTMIPLAKFDTRGSSRDLVEHKRHNPPYRKLFRHPTYEDIWSKLLPRKRGFDNLPDINLDNVFNPRPIKRKSRPTGPIATTYVGESVDEDDSPQHKLASLISTPIYHEIPENVRRFRDNNDPDNLRRYMYENTKPVEELEHSVLQNEDFTGNAVPESLLEQFRPAKYDERNNMEQDDEEDLSNGPRFSKRYNLFGKSEDNQKRDILLDKILELKQQLSEQQKRQKGIKRPEDKKKHFISEPYDSISLPVSESKLKPEADRKFYSDKRYAYNNDLDTDVDKAVPFKLQKKHLWGRIEKRWKRHGPKRFEKETGIGTVPRTLFRNFEKEEFFPRAVERERTVAPVVRSQYGTVGETGNSFDAYGGIGQDVSQTLVKLNPDSEEADRVVSPCKQNAQVAVDPDQGPGIFGKQSAPVAVDSDQGPGMFGSDNSNGQFFFGKNPDAPIDDKTRVSFDGQKDDDSGIIKVMDNDIKRSALKSDQKSSKRGRRAALTGKDYHVTHPLSPNQLHSKSKRHQKLGETLAGSQAKKRYFDADESNGLPDSRPTDHEGGIFEEDEHSQLEERLSHDSTPFLMKIAQHDREDMHKLWTNKHSPGNGFYAGHGEGPNNAYLGDYFGHDPDVMEKDDGIRSLEDSPSPEDHRTASIIDSIWEHDSGEEHVGTHRHEGHPGGEKVQSYFGHHDQGVLLPTETLEGFDRHWSGNLPHAQVDTEEHIGHPIDFSPTKIKAIQAIQDDPSIDAVINGHAGVGTEIQHHPLGSHHSSHDFGLHHEFSGGMPDTHALVNDQVHVEDSHEEEYKQHIDDLLSHYHGLEERLRGTEGSIFDHIGKEAFHHHGHNPLHTGFDLYAYKNPWDNANLPYHLPVDNHPIDTEAEPPAPPPTFPGGKGEEGGKGGPLVEGGKEEGGKGGPLVESKAEKGKEDKDEKNAESPKGGKDAGKGPPPVIPDQRGGPDQSAGIPSGVDSNSKSTNNALSTKGDQTVVLNTLLSSSDRQSEIVNELQKALKTDLKEPSGSASMQLAKLEQLTTLQKALIHTLTPPSSSLKSVTAVATESNKAPDATSTKPSSDLALQQLGQNIKANQVMQFLNAMKQNSNLIGIAPNTEITPVSSAGLIKTTISSNKADILPQNRQLQSYIGAHVNNYLNNNVKDLDTEALFSALKLKGNMKNTKMLGDYLNNGDSSRVGFNRISQGFQVKHFQQQPITKSRVKQTIKKHKLNEYHQSALDLAYSSIGNEGTVATVRSKDTSKREKTMSKPKTELRKRDKSVNMEQNKQQPGTQKASIVSTNDEFKVDEENLTKKGVIKKTPK